MKVAGQTGIWLRRIDLRVRQVCGTSGLAWLSSKLIYSSSHKIDSCPRTFPFFVFASSVSFFFLILFSLSFLFYFPFFFLFSLSLLLYYFHFSFLPSIFSFLLSSFPSFLLSLPSFFPLPLFLRFCCIFRPVFTSSLFLCRILASPEICACPVNVIPIIIDVTGSHYSNIPETEALPDAVPCVCVCVCVCVR